jgi:hypothetical protein
MLAAGTLPLYAIAFDNHPYYDEFNFYTPSVTCRNHS